VKKPDPPNPIQIAGIVLVVLLCGAIAFMTARAVRHSSAKQARSSTSPAAATAGGGLRIGSETAPVTVTIYLDYMCPYCGKFEQANGADLQQLVTDGAAKVELHPLAFLDRMSNGTEYSSRTANAAATVADRASDKLLDFTTTLYAHQPEENSPGLTDAQIAELAIGAGVPGAVADTFTAKRFAGWVSDATDKAVKSGIDSTPTILVNGVKVTTNLLTAGALRTAVAAAAAAAAAAPLPPSPTSTK